jgi:hypothetical protein
MSDDSTHSIRTLPPSVQPNCCSPLQERRDAGLCLPIVGGEVHQHADASHPLALLRLRCERPCRRAAEQRYELASPRTSGPPTRLAAGRYAACSACLRAKARCSRSCVWDGHVPPRYPRHDSELASGALKRAAPNRAGMCYV